MLRVFVPEATPQSCTAGEGWLRGALDEAQPVLDLRQPKLELLELVARREPKLGEDALEALACARREPRGIAAPARDGLLDQLACLVAPAYHRARRARRPARLCAPP